MRSNYLFIVLISIIFASCAGKNDKSHIETVRPLPEGHKAFISKLFPIIQAENEHILKKRTTVLALRKRYRSVIKRGNQYDWLVEIAQRYRFSEDFFNQDLSRREYRQRIDSLLVHVDIVPEKLVMAQAAVESGWGKSRFAKQGNSYFGMRCYRPGCGIPASEVENPNFWVKSYPTVDACVKEYLWNLNIGHAYDDLRSIRARLRDEGKVPEAHEMATALEKYSEIGNQYITLLISVMNNYLPNDLAAFVEHYHSENDTNS
jgi:Bax protein